MKLQGIKSIVVRNQFVALHRWCSAPGEVNFLSYPHRHTFHVLTTVEVGHGDRAVEFFCLQQEIDQIIRSLFFSNSALPGVVQPDGTLDLGLPIISMSCEDMAEHIANYVSRDGALKVKQVIVSEDNENGGVFTVTP